MDIRILQRVGTSYMFHFVVNIWQNDRQFS